MLSGRGEGLARAQIQVTARVFSFGLGCPTGMVTAAAVTGSQIERAR